MNRPVTTLLAVGIIIFLSWLWRNGRLGGLLGAILDPASSPAAGPTPAAPRPQASPGGKIGGGLADILRSADQKRRQRENPNDPILPDPYPPGTPGTWTPRLFSPFPNDELLRNMN